MTANWSDKLNSLYLACTCGEVDHGSESYPEPRMSHCNFHAAATDMYEVLEQLDTEFQRIGATELGARLNRLWDAALSAMAEANK